MMRMMRSGRPSIALLISADTTAEYDMYVAALAADSRVASVPVDVVLTVAAGIWVGSGANWAIFTGSSWQPGSTLKIVNNGFIVGRGGAGGAGGSNSNGGSAGNGIRAIVLSWPTTIDNTAGFIGGGGGGGGGGASRLFGSGLGNGGGGGAGQGYALGTPGAGGPAVGGGAAPGNGTTGTRNGTAGVGGAGGVDGFYGTTGAQGGNGGTYGNTGTNGSSTSSNTGGLAGGPGRAVWTNGNIVTWLGGNNASQVKGVVA